MEANKAKAARLYRAVEAMGVVEAIARIDSTDAFGKMRAAHGVYRMASIAVRVEMRYVAKTWAKWTHEAGDRQAAAARLMMEAMALFGK